MRDGRGDVVASLSVIVPNDAAAASLVPVVRTAARGISRTLAARGLPG